MSETAISIAQRGLKLLAVEDIEDLDEAALRRCINELDDVGIGIARSEVLAALANLSDNNFEGVALFFLDVAEDEDADCAEQRSDFCRLNTRRFR